MALNIPLTSMTTAEKLEALETIWADLCQTPADVHSPEWHEEILNQRRQRLASGEATVLNWSSAKQRLQSIGS